MKILFLTAYFYPERVASSYLLENRNERFANEGFEMLLYTPQPTRGISEETRKKYKKRKIEISLNGKLEVRRFSMIREGKNPVLRAFRYTLCFFKQFFYGCFAKNIDIVFLASTPPIQGILGVLLKKIRHVPFIYNLQDVFPDSLLGTGLLKKKCLFWKIGRVIEDYIYRGADKIVVISDDFKKNIMAKGVPEDKIEVVYNWVDENAVLPVRPENNKLYDELHLNRDTFKVVYAGNLGNAQNVKILLDAACKCKHIKDIEFIIFGKGGMESEYKQYVIKNKITNVSFFPLQPIEKVSEVYSLADISLVSCKKGLGGSAMPSKTWNIMSAGTPVICSFDKGGDLEHIIEDNKLGLFSEAGNVDALTENIFKLYNDRNMCRRMGVNARNFILSNLTKDIGTSKYVKIINDVLKSNK